MRMVTRNSLWTGTLGLLTQQSLHTVRGTGTRLARQFLVVGVSDGIGVFSLLLLLVCDGVQVESALSNGGRVNPRSVQRKKQKKTKKT